MNVTYLSCCAIIRPIQASTQIIMLQSQQLLLSRPPPKSTPSIPRACRCLAVNFVRSSSTVSSGSFGNAIRAPTFVRPVLHYCRAAADDGKTEPAEFQEIPEEKGVVRDNVEKAAEMLNEMLTEIMQEMFAENVRNSESYYDCVVFNGQVCENLH